MKILLNSKSVFFFSFLCNYYKDTIYQLAADNGEEYNEDVGQTHFQRKLEDKYGDLLEVTLMHHKKIVGPKGRKIDEYLYSLIEEKDIVQSAANILRRKILDIEKTPLPDNLRTSDVLRGECLIPVVLKDFYLTLLAGSRSRRRKHTRTNRISNSLAEDAIFNVTNGRVKTKKHLTLGLSLKSLTSSRKVVEIISRYGHCCSYHVAEEIETEMTSTSCQRSTRCPEGIIRTKGLHTGLAFDNFDRFVDTSSGKDTLHDTVGIIYQNVDRILEEDAAVFDEELALDTDEASEDSEQRGIWAKGGRKRRRSIDVITPTIEPYTKKIKMSATLISNVDEESSSAPPTLELAQTLDVLWMFSHALEIPKTPMWVGFNFKLIGDFNTAQQKICYLAPINESPTGKDVVVQTMKESQEIAKEIGEKCISVTYDLAIAKMAMQIQSTEKPRFDNLFIHLGGFHIIFAYFKAVGKFIAGCGLMNVAVDTELLASGSVNSFLDGKHFNRCKRLHPLMALGLEIMNFRSFLNKENRVIEEDLRSELMHFGNGQLSFSDLLGNREISKLIDSYIKYREDCVNGDYGKTAQFYMMYILFINHYLTLSRSIRTGDFSLYKYVMPHITNLFFAFNQQNYARWLVRYHNNLVNADTVNPEIMEELKKGYFGIQRTEKSFSRQPIDLTLEQTINADAAKRLVGIINFTNSISARQRWSLSHQIRSTIISYTYETTGLRKRQDVTADLENNHIQKDAKQLKKFINGFSKFVNPFDSGLDDKQLFNISTGKVASHEVEQFLLNVDVNGDELRKKFIKECSESEERFEKPIPRLKILNFSSEVGKKNIKSGGKVQEVTMQRDLFGRMLGLSMDHAPNIEEILCYPLIPIPMSLCHFDGTICKTEKSAIVAVFEKNHQPGNIPNTFDVVLVDGFFLIHTLRDVPATFGNISKKIMSCLTATKAPRVDIVFDQYKSPSIKDYERNLRNEANSMDFNISGPMQVRPTDFNKGLKNIKFKQALVTFLIDHWRQPEMVPFIGQTIINLNYDFCYSYKLENDNIIQTIDDDLYCENHEEADTKLVYHACQLESELTTNVLIKSCDTDILIIMLGNMENLKCDSLNIYMEYGAANKKRTLNLTQLYIELGPTVCTSLPGFHALTGCDYNPSFFKKGKKRPYQLIKQNLDYQKALTDLGNSKIPGLQYETFATLEKLVCELYGHKNISDINKVRFEKFCLTYKSKDVNEPFQKTVMKYDASNLPPCKAELHQHLLRTQYITSIWRNAHLSTPTYLLPGSQGWTLKDDTYEFKWFEGDCMPQTVMDAIKTGSSTDQNSTNEGLYLLIFFSHLFSHIINHVCFFQLMNALVMMRTCFQVMIRQEKNQRAVAMKMKIKKTIRKLLKCT